MDPHTAAIEQIVTAITAVQDTVHGLNKRIDKQQTQQISTQEDTEFDIGAPPPPPPPSMVKMAPLHVPRCTPFAFRGIQRRSCHMRFFQFGPLMLLMTVYIE